MRISHSYEHSLVLNLKDKEGNLSGKELNWSLFGVLDGEKESKNAEVFKRILVDMKETQNAGISLGKEFDNLTSSGQKLARELVHSKKPFEETKQGFIDLSKSADKMTLSYKAAAVGMKFLSAAMNAVVSIGVTLVITAIATAIYKVATAQQAAIDKANQLTEAFVDSSSKINANITSLEDVRSEFTELSKGIDENGRNIGLTTEQYKRYKEIVSTIIGISPSLVKGYNSENEALIDNNSAIEEAIKLQKQLNEQKNQEYISQGKDIMKGAQNEINNIQKSLSGYGNSSGLKLANNLKGVHNLIGSIQETEQMNSVLKQFGIDFQEIQNGNVDHLKKAISFEDELVNAVAKEYNLSEQKQEAIRNTLQLIDLEIDKYDIAYQKKTKFLSLWSSFDNNKDWYSNIDTGYLDEFNESLLEIVKNKDLSLEDMQVATRELGQSFLEIQDKIPTESIKDLQQKLADGKIDQEAYNSALTGYIAEIENMSASVQDVNPVLAMFLELIADSYRNFANNQAVIPTFTEQVGNIKTAMNGVHDAIMDAGESFSELDNAIGKVRDKQYMSGQEVANLVNLYPELAGHIIETANGYTFEASVLNTLRDAEVQERQIAIQAQIDKTQQEIEAAGRRMMSRSAEIESIKTLAQAEAALAEMDAKIASTNDSYVQGSINGSKKYGVLQEVKGLYEKLEGLKIQNDLLGKQNFNSVPSSKKEKDSKDAWKEAYEKERAALDRLRELDLITEQEFYNQLTALNDKYFKGRAKYLEDYTKNEIELFNLKRDLSKARITDMEHEIYMLQQQADTEEQQIKLYRDIQDEIHSQLNDAYDYGLDEHSDYVQELQKQWYDYVQKTIDIYEAAQNKIKEQQDKYTSEQQKMVAGYVDALDKQIDELNKRKDAASDYWDAQIDAYKKEHDALKEKEDLEEKLLNIEKEKQKLENLKKQKVLVYKKGQGFVTDIDQPAIDDQQKVVDDAQKDYDDTIKEIEYKKHIEMLEAQKKAALDAIDAEIERVKDLRDRWNDTIENIKMQLETNQEQLDLWNEYTDLSLAEQEARLTEFTESYKARMSEIQAAIQATIAAIEAMKAAQAAGIGGGAPGTTTWKGGNVSASQQQQWENDGWRYVSGANGGTWEKDGHLSYASGTLSAGYEHPKSGNYPNEKIWSLVGEHGPEIRQINRGDSIIPAKPTKNFMDVAKGIWSFENMNPIDLFAEIRNRSFVNPNMIRNTQQSVIFNGNLSFPNVHNGNDAQEFLREAFKKGASQLRASTIQEMYRR